MSKVLVVAAHPDDEVLGIGGTVRKHVVKGDTVYAVILGEGMTSRDDVVQEDVEGLHEATLKAAEILGYKEVLFSNFPDNKFDTIALLDIVREIEDYIKKLQPEIVYTHHGKDLNVDHRLTHEAVMTATRPMCGCVVKEVYTFETPSSTEWYFGLECIFNPNVFIDIKDTCEAKMAAMACYQSEIRQYPHPRSLEVLQCIAKRWGSVVGKECVEALQLIRKVD